MSAGGVWGDAGTAPLTRRRDGCDGGPGSLPASQAPVGLSPKAACREHPSLPGAAKKALWESINNGRVTELRQQPSFPRGCFLNCGSWKKPFPGGGQRGPGDGSEPQKRPDLQSGEKGDRFPFLNEARTVQSPCLGACCSHQGCDFGSAGRGKAPSRARRRVEAAAATHAGAQPSLPAPPRRQPCLESGPTAWPCCSKSWELCHGRR